jgi:hypothetical protein
MAGFSSEHSVVVKDRPRLRGTFEAKNSEMGLEQLREPSWFGYTSDCTSQVSIVPRGGLPVCVTVAADVCDEKTVAPDVFFLTVLSSDASLGRGKGGDRQIQNGDVYLCVGTPKQCE